jgi:hypothetical protein
MIELTVVTNPQSAATDFYRSVGPLWYIQKITGGGVRLKTVTPPNIDWHQLFTSDVVFFSRPNGNTLLDIIAEVKDMGKRVWVDYDDLLDGLSDYNPAKVHFGREDVKESVKLILAMADAVSVSTQYLKDYYQQYAKAETVVLKNAFDSNLFRFQPIRPQADPIRLHWRGSATHLGDLMTVSEPLQYAMRSNKWSVKFHGLQKWMLYGLDQHNELNLESFREYLLENKFPDTMTQTQVIQSIGSYKKWLKNKPLEYKIADWENRLFRYFRTLSDERPDWVVFPLIDDPFNQSKSNIAAIEALTAGAGVLAPAGFPEFVMPGIINYDDTAHLMQLIKQIEIGHISKEQTVMEGRRWMGERLTVQIENEKRMELINSITGAMFKKLEKTAQ